MSSQAEPPTAPPSVPPSAPAAEPEAEPSHAALDGRVLLQDWRPLGRCLGVEVGRQYWLRHAAELFADDAVPHWVHDNGAVSARTAQVLEAWCAERQARGDLPERIVVCEVGMGTGLHLRFALDAFRRLCAARGADWYDRLDVIATDVNADVARNAAGRGLFADHAPRVRLAFLDVRDPGQAVELDTGALIDLRGRVHLFIALCVLDLLPMDVLRRRLGDGPPWEAVWVRTWLRDVALLPSYTDATVDDLKALADRQDADATEVLAASQSLWQEEWRTWPVDLASHPDAAELERAATALEAALGADHPALESGTVVIHSSGAMAAVTALASGLADGGAVLVRDVGVATAERAASARGLARYDHVTAAAVNLFQIDGWLAAGGVAGIAGHAPPRDGQHDQCVRLLVKGSLPATEEAFRAVFDGDAVFASRRLVDQATASADPVAALDLIRQAIAAEPTDWTLHLEAGRIALHGIGRADVAHAIALRALELNPTFCPELWCLLGDAVHVQGDRTLAHRAYTNALAIHPRHPQSLWSMAWVEAERGRHGVAFELIGQALRYDRKGNWRAQILPLLDVCLRAQTLQSHAEDERRREAMAL